MKRASLALFVVLFLLCPALSQTNLPPSAPIAHVDPAGPVQSPERIWTSLMDGNQRFVGGSTKIREFRELRSRLALAQHPSAIVLTCSDSRVPPELLFDQTLGDIFVVRSAGNIADAIGVGSIEYAVEHLGSSVLVVLGHEKCGAVTAACSGEKMPSPNLQAIVDKIGPAVTHARNYARPDALIGSAIRENIHQSAKDVLAGSEILRHAVSEGKLTIVEALYKLDSGEVIRLSSTTVVH